MITEFDSDAIINKFENNQPLCKLAHCTDRIVLSDGRLAEVQIIITTRESEFCTEVNKMQGWKK